MRRAHGCRRDLHRAGLAGAGLWLALTRAAMPTSAPVQAPCRPQAALFEGTGRELIHAFTYRPAQATSQAVVLARAGIASPDEACWSLLAAELCRAGWWVIVPGSRPGLRPAGAGQQEDPAIAPQGPPIALSDSTELFVALVGAGSWAEAGAFAGNLGVAIGAIAWILPEAESLPGADALPVTGGPSLLLVASQKRQASLALASDLFSRFNTVAELWLLSWGETECEVLAAERQRRSLLDWLEAAARVTRAADEAGQGPAAGSASGKEPGR